METELTGSLVDSVHTRLRIYPSRQFTAFLNTLPVEEEIPDNILKIIGRDSKEKNYNYNAKPNINLNDDDVRNMKKINEYAKYYNRCFETDANDDCYYFDKDFYKDISKVKTFAGKDRCMKSAGKVATIGSPEGKKQVHSKPFLTTEDIDWVYCYLQDKKSEATNVPYLHVLLEGASVEMPENKVIVKKPALKARCEKLRAQLEGNEYTTMSLKITVDDLNVKIKHFEDISYQKHKQRIPFIFENWNKYIHKQFKVGKKEKEHQD